MPLNARAALGCSPAGLESSRLMARKSAWTLASTLVSAWTRSTSVPSNVARSSAFNCPASHAASVVPVTNGGLSETPVAPSITQAPALVAPMASSLTKAWGEEFEMQSIILNRLPIPQSRGILLHLLPPCRNRLSSASGSGIAPKRLVDDD